MKSRSTETDGNIWNRTKNGFLAGYGAVAGDVRSYKNDKYKEMQSRISRGRSPHNTTAFSIPVEMPEGSDKQPYDTLWLKTPDGAYAVVDTFVHNEKTGETDEAYAVIFSRDPTILAECLLRNRQNNFYKTKEAENALIIVAARLKKDIMVKQQRFGDDAADTNFENRKPRFNFSWVETAIQDFSVKYAYNRRRHGLAIQHRDTWRSASSAFWLEEAGVPKNKKEQAKIPPAKNGNGHTKKYHVYYYANPIHGNDSFLGGDSLESRKIRSFLKPFSLRLTEHPIDRKQADELVHARFYEFSSAIMRGRDPYRLPFAYDYAQQEINDSSIKGTLKKTGRFILASSLRPAQKIGATLATIEKKALAVSLLVTGAITLIFQVPYFLFAAGLMKPPSNSAGNWLTKFWRKFSEFISTVEKAKTRADGDMAEHMAFRKNTHFTIEGAPLHLDTQNIPHMHLVDIHHFNDVFSGITPYNAKSERDWAMRILFDATARPVGTIASEKPDYGYIWLHFREPNGMIVTKNDSIRTSISWFESPPLPGSLREKPITHLFEQELDENRRGGKETLLAVTMGDDGQLNSFGLTEYQNLPSLFLNSLQTVEDKTPVPSKDAFIEMLKNRPPSKLSQIFGSVKAQVRIGTTACFLTSTNPGETPYQQTQRVRLALPASSLTLQKPALIPAL